jgi:hypothetical protein
MASIAIRNGGMALSARGLVWVRCHPLNGMIRPGSLKPKLANDIIAAIAQPCCAGFEHDQQQTTHALQKQAGE